MFCPSRKHLTLYAIALLWAFALRAADYSEDPDVVREGRSLFRTHCAACHDLERDGIAPAIGAVTLTEEKDWLSAFVKDPQAMVDRGDARATELVREFKVVMPSFGLSDGEVESILAYIHARRFSSSKKKDRYEGSGGLVDPIPEKIPLAGIGLDLELAWEIPPSSDRQPRARINKFAAVRDGDRERLFVNDQNGFLYEIDEAGPQLFLDIQALRPDFVSSPGLATGLSSFAFSPNFDESGIFYTQHSEREDAGLADFPLPAGEVVEIQYVITEWRVDPADRKTVLGTGRDLVRIEMIDTSHGMQELAFNPAARKGDDDYGMLYVGMGDGGASYRRRPELFEDKGKIWGKILRIDPRGTNSANGRYGIPASNPFVGGTGLPEIYAMGFRNPNSLAWDSKGNLFVSEIGHANIEEVNLVEAGRDYGWPRFEGSYAIDLIESQEVFEREGAVEGVVDPLIQIDHDELRAIAGGFVYEGSRFPLLEGKYLFGGIATGRVFLGDVRGENTGRFAEIQLFVDGAETTISKLVVAGRADLRIGRDAAGEPYLLSKSNGAIWRVVGARSL